jgi:hypothetical protein
LDEPKAVKSRFRAGGHDGAYGIDVSWVGLGIGLSLRLNDRYDGGRARWNKAVSHFPIRVEPLARVSRAQGGSLGDYGTMVLPPGFRVFSGVE